MPLGQGHDVYLRLQRIPQRHSVIPWAMYRPSVYNAVGGPTSVTDPLNQTQNHHLRFELQLSTITDSLGQVAAFTYNAQGQPLTIMDARGNTTTFTYDRYGNRTSSTDPLHRTTTYAYDTQGNLTSQTDPRGNKTQYALRRVQPQNLDDRRGRQCHEVRLRRRQ